MTSSLEIAILRTVLYADVFDFPTTLDEIHHFLISDQPVSCQQIKDSLRQSDLLRQHLHVDSGYIVRKDRPELIAQRQQREQAAERLWPLALRYGAWLSHLPYVRMVALTGALAVRNSPHDSDDLDYLIVTRAGRVWLARAFAVLLVRVVRLRGMTICPNYVLAEDAMDQDRKDLFIAHQIAQMVPLSGHTLYERFRQVNAWADDLLPNASGPLHPAQDDTPGGFWLALQRLLETMLNGKLGDVLENWEYRRKLARFAPDLRQPNSSARLDESQVKGHFNDYGHIALQKYNERLRDYQVEDLAPPVMVDL